MKYSLFPSKLSYNLVSLHLSIHIIVDEKPKVIRISPETPSEVHENTLVTITFDTPVTRKTGTVYIGSSVSAITPPITLSSVDGLVATFTLPTMTAGRVYLTIPENTVQSVENGFGNEESRFNTNTFWTYTEGISSLSIIISSF